MNIRVPFMGRLLSQREWDDLQRLADQRGLSLHDFRVVAIGPWIFVHDRAETRRERAS